MLQGRDKSSWLTSLNFKDLLDMTQLSLALHSNFNSSVSTRPDQFRL